MSHENKHPIGQGKAPVRLYGHIADPRKMIECPYCHCWHDAKESKTTIKPSGGTHSLDRDN